MCGGGCGKIITIGAALIMPFAAPALGAAIMGADSIGASVLGGAIIGGAASGLTGGNIFQGTLMGGAGAGLGAFTNQMGGISGIGDSIKGGTFMSDAGNALSSGGGNILGLPSSSGANIAGMTGGEATPGVNTMGMAGNATDVNQASGSLLNQQGSSLMNPNGQIGMANPTGAATSGTGFTNATPESVNLAANTSTPVLAEDNPSITSQLGTGLMRALPGIVGHFANQGPDMSQLQAQLDAQNALTKQAFDMNVANTNAKSAIGDKLAVNAQSMDPNYYGLQAETAAKNADANAWADQEAKMRAAGYDDNYINSQRQKFALGASQNAGTAYDTGAQRGLQAQNATYGTAGSMYNTGLSGPSSNAADYLQLAKKGTTDATAAGAVVENIFSPVQKNNKTGLDAGVTA